MDWHRLFGLVLADFFTDSPFVVEWEKDLSLKQQILDVVIIRKQPGTFALRLPDGLEDLAPHNLLTFKSHQDTLSDWAIKELIGHYVNYRKQVSPSLEKLLPEEDFRLFAVCARFPQKLAGQVSLRELRPGVYDCGWGTDLIRVVALHQLPEVEHNAFAHLFSALPPLVRYASTHYQKRSPDTSTLVDGVIAMYRKEGFPMPYTIEDFRKEYKEEFKKEHKEELKKELLEELTPEEILNAVPVEELIKRASIKERLRGISTEELETYLKEQKNENGGAKP